MRTNRFARNMLVIALLAGCQDGGCKENPLDPDLSLENSVLGVSTGSVSIKVGQTVDVVASTKVPGSSPRVSSRNPGVATARVTGTGAGTNAQGTATISITGVQEGQTTIELIGAGDPAGTPPAVVNVVVSAITRTVALTPDFIAIAPGESRKLDCAVTEDGVPVSNPNVTYTSSAPGTATVAADGTVTGVSEGEATIRCALPTGEFDETLVQVRPAPTPMVPTPAQLPGSYSLTASKKADSCPVGAFPATAANTGIPVNVITGTQNPTVVISSNASINGIFNTQTGAYEGSGSTSLMIGSIPYSVVEFVTGLFTIYTDPSTGNVLEVRLTGTLSYFLSSSSAGTCMVEYDAIYRKPL